MDQSELTRRDALKVGAVGAAGLGVLTVAGPAAAFPGAQTTATVVVPWLDQPPPVPTPAQGVIPRQLRWEDLDTRLTPNSEHFVVKHYDLPDLSAASWRLSVGGLVARPLVLTLGSLLTQPRREVEFTMECAGGTGPPFFTGGIGNARWAGAQLRRLLRAARRGPRRPRSCSGAPTAGG